MLSYLRIINWKAFGRKWSWLNRREHTEHFLEGLRKIMKILWMEGLHTNISNRNIVNTK
jgi:hypothetical protein